MPAASRSWPGICPASKTLPGTTSGRWRRSVSAAPQGSGSTPSPSTSRRASSRTSTSATAGCGRSPGASAPRSGARIRSARSSRLLPAWSCTELLAGLPVQDTGGYLQRVRTDGLLHVSRRRLRQRLSRHARQHPHHPQEDRPVAHSHPRDRRRRRQVVRQRDHRLRARPSRARRSRREHVRLGDDRRRRLAGLHNVRFNPRQRPALPRTLPFATPLGYCGADRTIPRRPSTRSSARTATACCASASTTFRPTRCAWS